MKLYNTLTREKETLTPITPGVVKIYACGPTVYNYIHIGNARPICVFDVLRRYLEYRGLKVEYVQNFTDIDDKIIRRANEENTDFMTISQRYIAEYKTDAAGLNVREATIHPRATENIDEIIHIISTLVENGHAYAAKMMCIRDSNAMGQYRVINKRQTGIDRPFAGGFLSYIKV